MSDTPRTDAAIRGGSWSGGFSVCPSFSRTLERELAEAKRKLAVVHKAVDAAEAWDNAHTDKQLEAMTSFNESMLMTVKEAVEAELTESRAREVALREALERLVRWSCVKDPGHISAEDLATQIDNALTQPAPPVVPKSVADAMAESLEYIRSVAHNTKTPVDFLDLCCACAAAMPALAAYRETTKL